MQYLKSVIVAHVYSWVVMRRILFIIVHFEMFQSGFWI